MASMEHLELLLSDDFVNFSEQIRAIHEEKKALKMEFKVQFDAYNHKLKELDNKAAATLAEWEKLKESKNAVKK